MVDTLAERLQRKLREEAKTRRDLVDDMGFIEPNRGLTLLELLIDKNQLPGTQETVWKLSKVLDSSIEELNLLVRWQYMRRRIEGLEKQNSTSQTSYEQGGERLRVL